MDQGRVPDAQEAHVDEVESLEPIQPSPASVEGPLGQYQRKVREAWDALGDKVYPIDDPIRFAAVVWRDLCDPFRGIHSSDVLEAIKNYGTIVCDDTGRFYWTARIGIVKWATNHLEKFLPSNFREEDFYAKDYQAPGGLTPAQEKYFQEHGL